MTRDNHNPTPPPHRRTFGRTGVFPKWTPVGFFAGGPRVHSRGPIYPLSRLKWTSAGPAWTPPAAPNPPPRRHGEKLYVSPYRKIVEKRPGGSGGWEGRLGGLPVGRVPETLYIVFSRKNHARRFTVNLLYSGFTENTILGVIPDPPRTDPVITKLRFFDFFEIFENFANFCALFENFRKFLRSELTTKMTRKWSKNGMFFLSALFFEKVEKGAQKVGRKK